jgi:small subunit ribosomal protein S20
LPAKKAARQSVERHRRNQSVRSATRSVLYAARRAIEAGDEATAESAVQRTLGVLDRAVKKGVLHKNNASRTKSRLASRLNRLKGTAAS